MTKNPWDVVPKEAMGDAEKDTIFIAVGRALSEWEGLEGNLANIFATFCETKSEIPARAYGTILASGTRLDMLREAFGCYRFRKDSKLAGFNNFLDRVRNFAARRNEIAHGIVISMLHNGVNEGAFLSPAHYNSRKRASTLVLFDEHQHSEDMLWLSTAIHGKYCYTAAQIDAYRMHFRALLVEALEFYIALCEGQAAHNANNIKGDAAGA